MFTDYWWYQQKGRMNGKLSEYELMRLRNIKRNHEFLKSLGEYFKIICQCKLYSEFVLLI